MGRNSFEGKIFVISAGFTHQNKGIMQKNGAGTGENLHNKNGKCWGKAAYYSSVVDQNHRIYNMYMNDMIYTQSLLMWATDGLHTSYVI